MPKGHYFGAALDSVGGKMRIAIYSNFVWVFLLGVLVNSPGFGVPAAFTESKLKNGLEIIAVEDHKVPLVTIVLVSKAGAMTETKDIDGLTHLWEHMFFKGNKRLPNQEAFNKRVRQLGIIYNGDTSAEKVRYYFTLPSVYLDEGLEFMSDAIQSPLIEETELKKERVVVLDEYNRSASRPSFKLSSIKKKVIYGDLSYLRDPLGNYEIISNASKKQLRRIKDEVFVPQNSAIMIAGDFDPEVLKKLVDKHFGSWKNPKGWTAIVPKAFPKFPKTIEIVGTHPFASPANLSLTFRGPRARIEQQDSFAADVLITLLNLKSGKFYKKYVDSGLAHYAGLSYPTQSQTGELTLYASFDSSKLKEVKRSLREEPKLWLNENYFSKEQLEDVRRSLIVEHKYSLNKPSEYIKGLAFWWAVAGLDYYRDYIKNLQRTGFKEIRKFVKKYFIEKEYVSTILMNPKEAEALKLKDNTETVLSKVKRG